MAVPGKFTPVQRNAVPRGPPPSGKKSIPAFPIFAVVVYAIYLGVMIIGPKFVTQLADELDPLIEPLWRLVGAGVLFVVLALIIVYNLMAKPSPDPQDPPRIPKPGPPSGVVRVQTPPAGAPLTKFKPVGGPPSPKKEPIPKPEPKKVEDEAAKSQVIVYPLEVEGGIFGDTYIQLSPKKVLKLRSMVVEPEYLS